LIKLDVRQIFARLSTNADVRSEVANLVQLY